MTDTLVNILQMLSLTCVCVCVCYCLFELVISCLCSQSCCRLATACQWVVEASQMCTTQSSCTSTGGARLLMAQSTRWTDADTRWRYSMVSRQLYTVTNQLMQCSYSLMSLKVFFYLIARCILSTWSPSTRICQRPWMIQLASLFLDSSLMLVESQTCFLFYSIYCYFPSKTSWFCWLFLQVVYADNVQFGYISQKLSSVAYKGWKKDKNSVLSASFLLFVTVLITGCVSFPKAKLLKWNHFPWWAFCRSTTWVSIIVITGASPLLLVLRWLFGPCMKSPSISHGLR